jgi:uncharacterized CHY-type Zn-finger protein
MYAYDQLIHVSNIESPYRVAYRIRNLLEIPFIENLDKTDIDVWLTKEEELCIHKYENKLILPKLTSKQPIIPDSPISENSDHIVICVKCKELISEEEVEKIVLQKHAAEVVNELEKHKNLDFNQESPIDAINEIANSLNKKVINLKNKITKTNILSA